MQPPKLPNTNTTTSTTNPQPKRKPPTPQELIAHYKTQGLDQEQASIKVIEDLQNVLFRTIASNNKARKDRLGGGLDTYKKIDVISNRLAILDMKLDSKPGYGESFAIGIASGAALNAVGGLWPHLVKGIGQIWCAVRTATDPSTSNGGGFTGS